jgi:hypothetical protein
MILLTCIYIYIIFIKVPAPYPFFVYMKKNSNSKLKIIAATTSMSIFSLASVFVACFAWFTAARNVAANGSGFEVVSYDGLVKGITGHSLVSVSNDGTRTYNETPSITYSVDEKTGSITMTGDKESLGVYDSLQSTTVFSFLYVITFDANIAKSKSSNISIIPSTSTLEKDSLLKSDIKSSDNPMSSILTFSYGSSSTTSDGYSSMFSSTREHEEFLDISTPSYKQTLSGTKIDPSSITSSDEYYGFVYVSYQISNIEYIYNLNLGSEVLNSVTTSNITYKQDWKISIS